MWETIILHDFIQEERKQQFHNQVKAENSNQMIIIREEELQTPQATDSGPQIQGQGHKMVTSEAEANKDH